jgi:hypothetical protein
MISVICHSFAAAKADYAENDYAGLPGDFSASLPRSLSANCSKEKVTMVASRLKQDNKYEDLFPSVNEIVPLHVPLPTRSPESMSMLYR